MSDKEQKPIALDNNYKIRDNQFWYNNCSFRPLIEGKSAIKVDIEGLGEQTFYHSEQGGNPDITLSYTIPSKSQKWWEKNKGKFVTVKLLAVID
ncbi:hypothetical protein [Methanolobus sp.]|uniref:hypothetical protein n=1 Tax=Methanolobus sp. TaxID=1874737 RepID=UPI0025CDE8DA|nr:hypothetical protein [Methanolobus sp.]